MTAQTPLRVGLIGCGAHGRSLADALLASPFWELVACADPDPVACAVVARNAIDMQETLAAFPLALTSVEAFARKQFVPA